MIAEFGLQLLPQSLRCAFQFALGLPIFLFQFWLALQKGVEASVSLPYLGLFKLVGRKENVLAERVGKGTVYIHATLSVSNNNFLMFMFGFKKST
jgi:hypothetical protein